MSNLTTPDKINAISGKNTLVGYKTTSSGSEWITLPGVVSIGAPKGSVEDIDQTTISEDTKRTIAGMWEGEEITITLHYYTNNTIQKTFFELARAQTSVKMCYEYQDGTAVIFDVQLKSADMQDPSLSDTLKIDVVAKVNSKAEWTYPS